MNRRLSGEGEVHGEGDAAEVGNLHVRGARVRCPTARDAMEGEKPVSRVQASSAGRAGPRSSPTRRRCRWPRPPACCPPTRWRGPRGTCPARRELPQRRGPGRCRQRRAFPRAVDAAVRPDVGERPGASRRSRARSRSTCGPASRRAEGRAGPCPWRSRSPPSPRFPGTPAMMPPGARATAARPFASVRPVASALPSLRRVTGAFCDRCAGARGSWPCTSSEL